MLTYYFYFILCKTVIFEWDVTGDTSIYGSFMGFCEIWVILIGEKWSLAFG